MADREVTCAEISMRGKNQWQSGEERQKTWTTQENQDNRKKSGYSRSYDRWDRNDNTTRSSRDAEAKRIDKKQSEFSENSQCSRPAAVARGGYTQIVVNPMQLEDEAFTAWM